MTKASLATTWQFKGLFWLTLQLIIDKVELHPYVWREFLFVVLFVAKQKARHASGHLPNQRNILLG